MSIYALDGDHALDGEAGFGGDFGGDFDLGLHVAEAVAELE